VSDADNTGDTIHVYPVGSAVILGDVISARVTAIFIREGRVTYECVWWTDERNEEVVGEWEIRPDGDSARMLRVDPVL
jgi:hypothetical protein